MVKVSLIISNRNTGDLLKASLPNLKEIKDKYYENMEVIVVDNESTDGSLQVLSDSFPWVTVIQAKNMGLSAANNLGASKATGDYFLFLGADAYPRVDTIGKLVEYMEQNKKVGIATPRLSLSSGKPDHDAHRQFPTPWNSFTRLTGLYELFPKSKLFNSYFMGYEDLNTPHEIDACVFGFMLMPKSIFNEIGGFDSDYFAYGEDLDICYRVKQKGYKVMFLPQWESGYLKTQLKSVKAPLADRLKLAHSSTEAMRIFLRKNYSKKHNPLLMISMVSATYLLELQRLLGTLFGHIFKDN